MKRKNKLVVRALFIAALFSHVTLFMESCNNNNTTADQNKPEDTKKVAEEQNDAKFEGDKSKDAEFLVKAAGINLEEIKLGGLAQEKGMSKEIKDLGKMMAEQHQKSMDDLQALAAKKSITLPVSITDDGQKTYDKLSEKSGKDFDKAFADKMVDGHKDAISMFEKASNNAEDPEIKTWASVTLVTLHRHLDHATECQKKCEKM